MVVVVKKTALAIFLLAFSIRALYLVTLDNTILTGADAQGWDDMAMSLLRGEGFKCINSVRTLAYAFRPCLFPILLAGIYKCFGHGFIAPKLLLILLSSGTAVLTFLIAETVSGKRIAGVISGVIASAYPAFIYYSAHLVVDTLPMFFLALNIYSLEKGFISGKFRPLMYAGISFGLAILSRSIPLAFLPFILIAMAVHIRNRKRLLAGAGVFLISMGITISPWVIRNYCLMKHFVLLETGGGYALWLEHNPHATYTGIAREPEDLSEFQGLNEVEQDRLFREKALRYIRRYPGKFFVRSSQNFVNFFRLTPHAQFVPLKYRLISFLSFTPVLILAILGLAKSFANWRNYLLLYFVVLSFVAVHTIYGSLTRYRLPIMPYLIIFSALGISAAARARSNLACDSETRKH